jgi:two-component system cell cycle response regulator
MSVGSEAPGDRETAQTPQAPLVLVAEDDRIMRQTVTKTLIDHGLRVDAVEDGQQALDRVRKGGISLVILDIIMPKLSGIECCRIIKSVAEERILPVQLLTSKNDMESRIEGLRIGADDYVGKPFDERELLARVDNLLRVKKAHDEMVESKKRLEQLAIQDELTGVYNYRYMHTRLAEEFKRAQRYRYPLACAMIDIDHFKQFNDEFGHDVGDAVLREVATRIGQAVREVDVVARYGGEEFLLVLPNTHFAGALTVADRVWRSVGGKPVPMADRKHRVTVSVGVSLYPSRDIKSKDQLLKSADEALYRAKNEGRDRICVFQQQGYLYRPTIPPSTPPGSDS